MRTMTADAPPPDELLSPREAALATGVSTKTLARAADAGELPAETTTGGHRRYRASDVRAYSTRRALDILSDVEHLTVPRLPGGRDGYATWLLDETGSHVTGPDGARVAVVITRDDTTPALRDQLLTALIEDAA